MNNPAYLQRKSHPWLFVIGGIVLSVGFMVYPDDISYIQVAGFFIFVLFQMKAVQFDLAHPYVWFLPIFLLYSIAGPALVLSRVLPYIKTYNGVIFYHYVAAVTMVLVIGPRRYSFSFARLPFNRNSLGIKAVFTGSLAVCLIYILFLLTSGIQSKYDRALSSNPFAFLGFGFYMLTTAISMALLEKSFYTSKIMEFRHYRKGGKLYILFFILIFVFATLITGERHSLFRMMLVIFVAYHILQKTIQPKYLILAFVMGIAFGAVLNQLKMVFSSEHAVVFSYEQFLTDLLFSEFKAPTRNMAVVLLHFPSSFPYFYGEALWGDIMRAFVPGFLFPKFQSSTNWFNLVFHYNTYKQGLGLGFTLVGSGYINFGPAGVVMLFSVLALMIRKLYAKASNSPIMFLIYVNFIPIVCFSVRADVATLISSLWKHIGLVIFIVWIIDNSVAKRKYSCQTKINYAPDTG
ncbi:MAG: oligosaccharide repeat unit polymerase [Desulfobacterales bacterium]|nr:oligosaccharide repeat unit polymerase [Desulfobacterales bacterium]